MSVASIAFGVGQRRDDPICGKSSGSKGSDVVVAGDAGPVPGKDFSAIGVDFAEGDRAVPCAFEAKTKTRRCPRISQESSSCCALKGGPMRRVLRGNNGVLKVVHHA